MKNCSIEISAPALRHNIKVLSKKLPKKTKLLCVIKANAYGHGFDEVSTILNDVPLVDWFGVFDFDDAVRLRQKTKKPILVLANTPHLFWDTACKKKISITLSTGDELKQLTKYENNKKNPTQENMSGLKSALADVLKKTEKKPEPEQEIKIEPKTEVKTEIKKENIVTPQTNIQKEKVLESTKDTISAEQNSNSATSAMRRSVPEREIPEDILRKLLSMDDTK
jgi:cellobiose-specific phosphotransferase system component IIB